MMGLAGGPPPLPEAELVSAEVLELPGDSEHEDDRSAEKSKLAAPGNHAQHLCHRGLLHALT